SLSRLDSGSATYMPENAYCVPAAPACAISAAAGKAMATSASVSEEGRCGDLTIASISSTQQVATSRTISGSAARIFRDSAFISLFREAFRSRRSLDLGDRHVLEQRADRGFGHVGDRLRVNAHAQHQQRNRDQQIGRAHV